MPKSISVQRPESRVIDDVVAADVLVNDVRGVNRRRRSPRAESRCASRSRNRRIGAPTRSNRRSEHARQVLEHERDVTVVPQQVVGLDDARDSRASATTLVLVAVTRQLARGHGVTVRTLDDDARAIARAPRAKNRRRATAVDRLTALVAREGLRPPGPCMPFRCNGVKPFVISRPGRRVALAPGSAPELGHSAGAVDASRVTNRGSRRRRDRRTRKNTLHTSMIPIDAYRAQCSSGNKHSCQSLASQGNAQWSSWLLARSSSAATPSSRATKALASQP